MNSNETANIVALSTAFSNLVRPVHNANGDPIGVTIANVTVLKPIAMLTKKGYKGVCEYIHEHTTPNVANKLVNIFSEASRVSCGFAADAMSKAYNPMEFQRKKENAYARGETTYKYKKTYYRSLREKFPTVPSHIVAKGPRHAREYLETYRE